MPKSAAERQRERRARLREDDTEYFAYKEADANRKRMRRDQMSEAELKRLRKNTKMATRTWRATQTKNRALSVIENVDEMPFRSPASYGKARRKAEKSLPKSPRKKAAIVKRLASDVLKVGPTIFKPKSKGQNDETSRVVREYYELDSISRVMPGKADVITIKNPDGTKAKAQKRHMVMTIAETYEMFKSDNPGYQIGKSKFASLRPNNVLLTSQMPHNVCGCKYHNNIILLLESLHRQYPDKVPLYSKSGFVGLCVCDIDSEMCMSNNCASCNDGKLYQLNIVSKLDSTNDIKWYQWAQSEYGYIEKQPNEGTVGEALDSIGDQLPRFLWHVFIKGHQEKSYEGDKTQAKENDSAQCLLQMDFAENFTVSSQDEIQSAHWKQRQISIYTVMITHRDTVISWIIASDVREHEKRAVATYTALTLDYVRKNMPTVKDVKIWTDGPSSQYKSKYIFALVPKLSQEFNVRITWNYFATSHGKGPNDALGGNAKRIVHRLVMSRKKVINGAESFAEALRSATDNIMVSTVSQEDIDELGKSLSVDELWAEIPAIPGTINTHFVDCAERNEVACKFYTASKDVKLHLICRQPNRDVSDGPVAENAIRPDEEHESEGQPDVSMAIDVRGEKSNASLLGESAPSAPPDVVQEKRNILQPQPSPLEDAEPKTVGHSRFKQPRVTSQQVQKRCVNPRQNQTIGGNCEGRKYPCTRCSWNYGDKSDPKRDEAWVKCIMCHDWFHETCAEDSGIIEDSNDFTCIRCF